MVRTGLQNNPKKLKIGGKTYQVEVTNHLEMGTVEASAEISDKDLVIRVTPQAKQKMEADFIHEMVHGILYHLGYVDHDEKKVDEMANALYMVIQDNKSVFSEGK